MTYEMPPRQTIDGPVSVDRPDPGWIGITWPAPAFVSKKETVERLCDLLGKVWDRFDPDSHLVDHVDLAAIAGLGTVSRIDDGGLTRIIAVSAVRKM